MKERIRVRLGAETVLVFGPESVSYERSRRENRTILREISARVFFEKIKKINKNHTSNISRISGNSRKHVPKIIQGSTTQPLEPPARIRPPAARISRIPGNQKTPISSISRIWEIGENPFSNISRIGENSKTQISNLSRIIENVADLNFQYFQDGNK